MDKNAENNTSSSVENTSSDKQNTNFNLKKLLIPALEKKTLIRIAVLIIVSWIFFSYICIPLIIKGKSMEPTYSRRGFTFCWRPAFMFSKPQRKDIVIVRYAGRDLMLLKRIVAFEGDTVEFRDGILYVNGEPLEEEYVKYPCDWDLSLRTVDKNKVYVIGDNRSVPIDKHKFGQVSKNRIIGVPLW